MPETCGTKYSAVSVSHTLCSWCTHHRHHYTGLETAVKTSVSLIPAENVIKVEHDMVTWEAELHFP
jgi:hypothetical protein